MGVFYSMKNLSVVCTINRCSFLEQCIKSILASDYRNFEFIIVDQSSDDKTSKMVNRCNDSNIHIKYLHCNSQGAAHAKNYKKKN